MRQGNENGIILNEQGQIVAVNLGADYCAEHEWGIRRIQIKFGFGLNDSHFGLERRKITKSSTELLWVPEVKFEYFVRPRSRKLLKFAGLFYDGYNDSIEKAADCVKRTAYASPEKDLISLWCESEFCVMAHKPEQIAQLQEVYNAFASNDIAIWRGGGHVFKNAGLCIAIASRLSQEVLDNWKKGDEEQYQLTRDVEKTGIESKLKEANKGYYALAPRRKDDGSIVFFLNPMQQDKNNSGWFTIQELEQWCAGTGPIPKKV